MTPDSAGIRHDAIDPTWMTAVLENASLLQAGRVRSIVHEPCGTGLLADSYRFTLTYEPVGAGPRTVVGKFASADPISREYGFQSGQYRNEVRFYQSLANTLSVATPTPIHADLADNQIDFVVLMDDLGPARAVDQLVGCTADEAALVVEQIALLHGGSWHRSDLARAEWLKSTISSWIEITDGFASTVAAFPELSGGLVPDADVAQAARLVPYCDSWKAILSEPRSLWHNDLRADNVLFNAKGGRMPVAILDWQGVTYARGMMDVAYFLGTSLTPEVRREHERDLVNLYHAALVAAGVGGYALADCWDEYRLLAIHPLQTGVFGFGVVKRTPRADAMWHSWIVRAAVMTRDLESFDLLRRWSE